MLTSGEVARLFRVNRKTVTRWARRGILHPIRIPGGQYRFPRAEVIAMAGPVVASQLEARIRAELTAEADGIEPDPDALAKIQHRIRGDQP